MPLYIHDGKLLTNAGALAAHSDCCCGCDLACTLCGSDLFLSLGCTARYNVDVAGVTNNTCTDCAEYNVDYGNYDLNNVNCFQALDVSPAVTPCSIAIEYVNRAELSLISEGTGADCKIYMKFRVGTFAGSWDDIVEWRKLLVTDPPATYTLPNTVVMDLDNSDAPVCTFTGSTATATLIIP